MKKVTAQNLLAIFANYDAGTRTGKMRKLADKKTCEFIAESACVTDEQFNALTMHSKLPSGKVAMMQTAKAFALIASAKITSDVKHVDKAVAGCMIVSLLSNQTSIVFENLRFALSAKGNENSKHIDGVSGSSLRKSLGAISNVSTVSAQCSRSIGKNGLLGIFGITKKDSAHSFAINAESDKNAFLVAYCKALSQLPEGALVAHMSGADSEAE